MMRKDFSMYDMTYFLVALSLMSAAAGAIIGFGLSGYLYCRWNPGKTLAEAVAIEQKKKGTSGAGYDAYGYEEEDGESEPATAVRIEAAPDTEWLRELWARKGNVQ